MAQFRKKPVEVEAFLFDGLNDRDALAFIGAPVQAGNDADTPITAGYSAAGGVVIPTREGPMLAEPGDWIIREPFPTDDRRFYPCKPEQFAATYEPAEPLPAPEGRTEEQAVVEAARRLVELMQSEIRRFGDRSRPHTTTGAAASDLASAVAALDRSSQPGGGATHG